MSDVYEGRNAAILRATIDGTEYNDPPQSVIEGLLIELKEAIEAGGGGGGTTNYNALSNKPQINSVTLQGNESLADLGIQPELTFDSTPTAGSSNPVTSGGVKTALDAKQDTLTIDSALSGTSENPVQNKVIKAALDNKQDTLTIDSALSLSSENPVQNKVLTLILGDKLSVVQTMGTASATLLGAIVLYDGATSASYTKGHLYECQEVTPATDPATYQWVDLSVQFDSALSSISENAVQNKVIYEQIYQKLYSTIAGRTQNAKGSMELYSVDLDTIVTSGFYNAMTCTHAPASYCALIVCGYYMSGYCFQQAVDINTGIVYTRVQTGGTWSSWEAINNSLVHA